MTGYAPEVYVKRRAKQCRPCEGAKLYQSQGSLQTLASWSTKKENQICMTSEPGDKYDVDKECEKLDDKERAQEEARKRRAREAR